MTPAERGRADYLAGKRYTDNPYSDPAGIEQADWLYGWNQARREKRKVLCPVHDGLCADLPDTGGTTMWYEEARICPNDREHKITGSTRRLYCAECGFWWWREGWGTKRIEEAKEY